MLSITSTLLMLAAAGILIHYFYALTALLGCVLIITYILVGPVNLMEQGIEAVSKWGHQFRPYQAVTRYSPEANPRILAVLVVYAVVFIGLTVGSIRFLPLLGNQLGDLGHKMGIQAVDAADTAMDWIDSNIGQGTLRDVFQQDITQAEQQGTVRYHQQSGKPVSAEEKEVIQQTVIQSGITQLENLFASAIPNLISVAAGTVNGLVYFLAGMILIFYFLIDAHRLKGETLRLLPRASRPTATYLLETFHQVMFAFIKGQVLLGILTGFYMFLIYSIFHVPYAFLLGCIFALAELLPVVGTWVGIVIGLTVILLNMDPVVALYVWACSYAYQTIKDNILAPKVVGDVMGLHPMVILLALLICAQVAGLLGVLLALPLASAINVIWRLLLQKENHLTSPPENVSAGGGPYVEPKPDPA
ncbi:AI-2E family transporter [Vampirovibrio sp.]|uniref:AI-2E family transporter n=1 Tax=Vampirovibrio sp. TaxID=2717857 RepID=UPI0035940934